MSDHRLSVDAVFALVAETLVRCGTSRPNAESVARALVGAELAGQSGHGLRRLASYAAQARSGKVDGMAVPVATWARPGVLAVDADHGFAFPALDLVIDLLPAATRTQGIAIAGICRSHHSGVAGLTVEALARQGLVALMFANTPAAMAPWGAARPLLGTNPIAFAAPVREGEPVVVDVSLSKVARGRIMTAQQKGEEIPEGWALDGSGRPTTDPAAALAGTMIPMGDAKGAALAIMVEMLSAGLTGANYAFEASSYFDAGGSPPGTGQSIIAIDPAAFGPAALERFALLAELIGQADGARLPGRRRQAVRAALERDGIAVDDELLKQIRAVGDDR